jgi:hypothetical protein
VAQDNPELVNADGRSRLAHGRAFYAIITTTAEPVPRNVMVSAARARRNSPRR